jgi:bifunctional enzyme CysN/CysC
MELLRIATAGSVDDGKSTLIGRLLYDSKSVLADQLAAVERTSVERGDEQTNLALLTDGLRAEREQGITIDVAYRYFATAARSFILADTPGHVQYTRNMVTGASTADVAIVLVDARRGLTEQSRRHAYLAGLLRVPHVVLCVNKIDLVDFDADRYADIVADFAAVAAELGLAHVTTIPVSALHGDNVVARSPRTPWYDGPALLEHLETVSVADGGNATDARLPVQYVIRPQSAAYPDYRGYAGSVASGVLRVGDAVTVLPAGQRSSISAIDTPDGPVAAAFAPMAVTVRLADDLDLSRGDVIAGAGAPPTVTRDLSATVCWMQDAPLRPGDRVSVKSTTRTVRAIARSLDARTDVTTYRDEEAAELRLNDIGRVTLRTAGPVVVDDYVANRATGGFLLLDETTGTTAGAGMIGALR